MPLSAPKPDAYFPERNHSEEQHPEPNTSWAVDETLNAKAPVDHWHELPSQLDSANRELEQAEDLDASFHEQLAALVRALGEEAKPQQDPQTAHAADVTDRTESPQLKTQVPEQKGWLPDWRLISLATLNDALDGRARGFVAGLGASIAVGAAALALAGGVEEPPTTMASIEAQDSAQVVAEAQSEPLKVEAQSEPVEVDVPTELPLRATLPGDIANAQIESGKFGATEDGSGTKYLIAAIPGTMVVPATEAEQTPEPPLFSQQSTDLTSAAPVAGEANVEDSNRSQAEPSEEVALNFQTTVETISEKNSESTPSVEESASETERAYAVKYANLRAGPTNSAAVLAIIPEGSPVEVIQCKQWCEVIAQGQRGWVYKDLIRDHNG